MCTWQKAKFGDPTIGLTTDVKDSHRQVPIHRDGCRVLDFSSKVFVDIVGMFLGFFSLLLLDCSGCFVRKTGLDLDRRGGVRR